jgi:hypothetical protein
MEVFGNTTLPKQGLQLILASTNDNTSKMELVAMTWRDQNHCFFVMTTCGVRKGEKISCKRLCQLDMSGRKPQDKVIIEVAQPKAIAKYYKGAGTINWHNRICADKLQMDCNLATKHWDKRFNLGVLGIVCIGAYLFFQQVVHADNRTTSCLDFFGRLADKLVDNQEGICLTLDVGSGRTRCRGGHGCHRCSNAYSQEDYLLQAAQQGES